METETLERELSGGSALPHPHLPSLFRGRGEYSIDDKGRLTLPAQMRRPLADGGNLVVLDGRIIVWTEAAYRAAVDLLNEQVAAGEVLQMHVRTFLSNTHPVGPDAQGRIVIPPAARVEGGLERDVLVLGAGPRIEIVPAGGDDLLGLLGIDDSIVDALDKANF